MNDLEKSILSTISYYDILNTPLTALEIYRYLFKTVPAQIAPDFLEIQKCLDTSPALKKNVENLWGFYFLIKNEIKNEVFHFSNNQEKNKHNDYFLNSRKEIVKNRISRDLLLDKKWKKLISAVKWLNFLPFLELAFVSGSMAVGHIKKTSDFDLLLSFKNGRIWTGRFFAMLLFEILRIRRRGHIRHPEESGQDKICLYHFITKSSYENRSKNIYQANIYKRLMSVFDSANSQKKFFEDNFWINDYFILSDLPRLPYANFNAKPNHPLVTRFVEKIFTDFLGDLLEKALKRYQYLRIQKSLKMEKHSASDPAALSSKELKFEPKVAKEISILNEYQRRLQLIASSK